MALRCSIPQIASKKIILIIVAIICFITILSLQSGSGSPPGNRKTGIVHIVLFEFKSDAKPDNIRDVCRQMIALKDKCLHPTSNKPYVKSVVGGKDDSSEGHQDGITHGFVVEFDNDEDMMYYIEQDPAHLGFVSRVGGLLARAQVVDFVPGVFG